MNDSQSYGGFRQIDGSHPFKSTVPDGCVEYPARRRHDGEVTYFDFALAREMGLIGRNHPDRVTAGLRRAILDTFCIVIVNEYDRANRVVVPLRDQLPNTYMATRYLQLQHPDGRGLQSGDGRSVWNGTVRHKGVTWDVSSCGTGVTRLCPATSAKGEFLQTGNWESSYGCGTAAIAEGIEAALMSQVFRRNGVPTERVLAVIGLPEGLAINVRAGQCLLRPSHFFVHLRQRNLEALRSAVDLYIDRMIDNGRWSPPRGRRPRHQCDRYRLFAEETARTFARTAALFESEYIFCWMDWDGDNILADGGIIDYGSVRQFGLYHREYRFDDVDRWSTTIPEQRRKARHIVRKIDQIRDALVHGKTRPLRRFRSGRLTTLFDREFEAARKQLLLEKMGFDAAAVSALSKDRGRAYPRFRRAHGFFERARAARGPIRVPDGLSWNAVYSSRDLLRELPTRWLAGGGPIPAREVLDLAASSYASRSDRRLTTYRRRMCRELQTSALALIERAASLTGRSSEAQLRLVAERSAIINQRSRITGDAIDYAADAILKMRRRLSADETYALINEFACQQERRPDTERTTRHHATLRKIRGRRKAPHIARLLDRMAVVVEELREGL
jgi:hypothetical protein